MAQGTHTYLKSHRLSGKQLSFDLGAESAALLEKARAAKSGRAAKTLVKEGPFRVTAVALRRGTALDEHQVDGAVSIQALSGRARLEVGDEAMVVPSKSLVTLQPGVPHVTSAMTDCALLITMTVS